MLFNSKVRRAIAVFLLVQFSFQVFSPSVALALTSGPTQPEFSSFEPVGSTNMVDEFTGDFTYNLPLLEVPGPHGGSYPVSISYHSGASPEEEASWVGYGWSLNAGAINRSVRGLPDDYRNSLITNHNKTPDNWTVTLGAGVVAEVLSKDPGMFTPSLNATFRYNNYRGFGLITSAGISLGKGVVSMGYSYSEGDGSFSLNVSPMAILDYAKKSMEEDISKAKDKEYTATDAFRSFYRAKMQTTLTNLSSLNLGSRYGITTFGLTGPLATNVGEYTGTSVNVSAAFAVNPSSFEIGLGFNVMGSFSIQSNTAQTPTFANGFLYSSFGNESNMMDFHYEKDNPFDKQDEFIGIPFNDADQFIVSGEGIGGGFRLYHAHVGHFGPTKTTSTTNIFNLSPELEAGLNWGGGVEVGAGRQTLKLADWISSRSTAVAPNAVFPDVTAGIDEPAFFRFNNDLGGSWGEKSRYGDEPTRFAMGSSGPVGNIDFAINSKLRGGRSSYIGYHTNAQINADVKNIMTYSKRDWSFFVDREANDLKIGEMEVTNEDGAQYVYGLPVYSRNERNLNFGLDGIPASKVERNSIAYEKKESLKVGQERPDPYAYSYLLTEILTPDYLDKPDPTGKRNGPTPDDFGGYVRFGYTKSFGNKAPGEKWFKWRMPYNGVAYQRNKHSDTKDDVGTLTSGEKEIYYLNTIETKTHVALFYTSPRTDGLGALNDDLAMPKDQKSADALMQLDKIELYSLSSVENIERDDYGNISPETFTLATPSKIKPVKTVHLKYAPQGQELMNGAPNNSASTRGKLTLVKIYTEYNDVVTTKQSPYLFEYKYPTFLYPSAGAANYTNFDDFGYAVRSNGKYSSSNGCGMDYPENPSYSAFNVDAWGNYQMNGCQQHDNMRPWLDQSQRPNIDFDPAPWHLKRITLPSGGELHVQYEQDDYSYVQDQEAHVMIPLKATLGENKFSLDLTKLGYANVPPAEQQAFRTRLISLINSRYKNGKKMYYKFLYSIKGSHTPTLDVCNTNAEYITGYAPVLTADELSGDVTIELSSGSKTPREICKQFVFSNVVGNVNTVANCQEGQMLTLGNTKDSKKRALQMVQAFLGATTSAAADLFSDVLYCKNISLPLSYLRVPAVLPKKGGGVRVKRLLMYDNSAYSDVTMEGQVLYGNTYRYEKMENGVLISSGVATNEPSSIREENILTDYLPKRRQDWTHKMVAGRDKEVQEGPIGESVYPGASVGYSNVIVTNIYSGKTTTGYSISEYNTAREYPVKVMKTDLATKSKNKFKLGIFANKFINYQNAVQGFSIVLNNMHGQLKRKAAYSGVYNPTTPPDKLLLVSEQILEHFAPGENVPVMSSAYGTVTNKSLGREVDFTLAQRSIVESSVDGNTEIDLSAGFFGFVVLPMLNLMGSITKHEGSLNTHVTTKVIRYPALVKKITSYQDGIYHTDENAAFSDLNGKPVAVKSKDEFKGAYLKQTIPAGWEYPNFGQSSMTENKVFSIASGTTMMIYPPVNGRYLIAFTGTNSCGAVTNFSVGDHIKLATSGNASYFHIESVDYGSDGIYCVPSSYAAYTSVISPTSVYQINILETGRNNRLNESAGGIVFHDPTKDNIDPQDLTDGSRFQTNSFTTALGSFYAGASTTTILPGPYTDINMLAFGSYAPTCVKDWTNAKVRNLNFSKVAGVSSSYKTLVLSKFEIECPAGSNSYIIIER